MWLKDDADIFIMNPLIVVLICVVYAFLLVKRLACKDGCILETLLRNTTLSTNNQNPSVSEGDVMQATNEKRRWYGTKQRKNKKENGLFSPSQPLLEIAWN